MRARKRGRILKKNQGREASPEVYAIQGGKSPLPSIRRIWSVVFTTRTKMEPLRAVIEKKREVRKQQQKGKSRRS